MLFVGLYALLFVVWIWLVVIAFRESSGWGIVTFLFWPAAIILLFRNWGAENDIKVPFIALAIVTVFTMSQAKSALEDFEAEAEEDDPAITQQDNQ